ncbi:hypothetical protein GCM10010345_82820 [Streptomyces canarius]|uniref:Uncharacterized protein n=1 Tax=Streptomyces canarius TaxID=285453 RepID=A0ABQ3D9L8_9ACTN|nr:hypothetical protein GCM10010345_82820 [Streptomyces canarius]
MAVRPVPRSRPWKAFPLNAAARVEGALKESASGVRETRRQGRAELPGAGRRQSGAVWTQR